MIKSPEAYFGGDGEDRTPDLCNANATLSQLSYAPIADTLYHKCSTTVRIIVAKPTDWLRINHWLVVCDV